jgi:hypothetical protein
MVWQPAGAPWEKLKDGMADGRLGGRTEEIIAVASGLEADCRAPAGGGW